MLKASNLLLILTVLWANIGYAEEQITFKVSPDIIVGDLEVKIGENVIVPDITIKIGKNVIIPDFSVGVTSKKSQAHFVITTSIIADYEIKAGPDVIVPDLSIKAGSDVIVPDLTIKINTSGTVDWIVYTEKEFISINDLVIALLPVINYKTKGQHTKLNEMLKK